MNVIVEELKLKDIHPPLLWEPKEGSETIDFVSSKCAEGMPKDAMRKVVFEAQQILGRCLEPSSPASEETGLVVGYVQSGKTMSFTTLTALARDNGYGLVILIAGTLDNLRKQTRERLRKDLRVDSGPARPWVLVDNPSENTSKVLTDHIKRWLNPVLPVNKRRTVIVVVLKHSGRLKNLRDCLNGLNMAKVPTLVIDDEADQASLNTFAARNRLTGSNKKSASYREVTQLKQALPHHTYVQYTATPQANLLVALTDTLSPAFAEIVSPGDTYVGGKTIFAPNSGYTSIISSSDAPASLQTHSTPPSSLVEALLIFLLGACAVEVSGKLEVRSMMVHPSQQTGLHNDYLQWVSDLITGWRDMLDVPVLYAQLAKSFDSPYKKLQRTVGQQIPHLSELLSYLPSVLHTVSFREVNSTGPGAGSIDWSSSEYWILVGGAKLDRGYTVEGLSVTYMPRPLGVGNADTLQQRARFYGYKKKYLGYCRVYLLQDVHDAFTAYVDHEEAIHDSLRKTRGFPLHEWKRQFVLDEALSPTRKGVIGMPLDEVKADGWVSPKAMFINPAYVTENHASLIAFIASLGGMNAAKPANEVDPNRYIDKRKAAKNQLFEAVPIAVVQDEFLAKLRFGHSEDEIQWAGILLALQKLKDEGQTSIDVFVIGSLAIQERSKRAGSINQVFSGQSPDKITDRALLNYGGDRSFHSEHRVSLQLRLFDLKSSKDGPVTEQNVPWYAIHIPKELGTRLLLQGDGT